MEHSPHEPDNVGNSSAISEVAPKLHQTLVQPGVSGSFPHPVPKIVLRPPTAGGRESVPPPNKPLGKAARTKTRVKEIDDDDMMDRILEAARQKELRKSARATAAARKKELEKEASKRRLMKVLCCCCAPKTVVGDSKALPSVEARVKTLSATPDVKVTEKPRPNSPNDLSVPVGNKIMKEKRLEMIEVKTGARQHTYDTPNLALFL